MERRSGCEAVVLHGQYDATHKQIGNPPWLQLEAQAVGDYQSCDTAQVYAQVQVVHAHCPIFAKTKTHQNLGIHPTFRAMLDRCTIVQAEDHLNSA